MTMLHSNTEHEAAKGSGRDWLFDVRFWQCGLGCALALAELCRNSKL